MPLLQRKLKTKTAWIVRISYSFPGCKEKQLWKTLKTTKRPSRALVAQTEAELWARVEEMRHEKPKPTRKPQAIVQHTGPAGVLVKEYLVYRQPLVSLNYYKQMHVVLQATAEFMGDCRIGEWTLQRIREFLAQGRTKIGWAKDRKKPWTERTYNIYRVHIIRFLAWCVAEGKLAENPARDIVKLREQTNPPRIHDREEIERILEACRTYDETRSQKGPYLEFSVRLALATGMRVGEMIAADWSWISFERHIITIPAEATKGKSGRVVPISSDLEARLLETPKRRRRGKLIPGLRSNDDRGLQKALEQAGLPHCGWHRFRHDFVSYCLMAGIDPRLVQDYAGHDSLQTTMRYARVTEKHREEGRERLPF